MANTTKGLASIEGNQALQGAINISDMSLSTSGFLVGKVGRKIDVAISTTNVANDTETYSFSESGSALYALRLVYTSGTRETLLSAERIS